MELDERLFPTHEEKRVSFVISPPRLLGGAAAPGTTRFRTQAGKEVRPCELLQNISSRFAVEIMALF